MHSPWKSLPVTFCLLFSACVPVTGSAGQAFTASPQTAAAAAPSTMAPETATPAPTLTFTIPPRASATAANTVAPSGASVPELFHFYQGNPVLTGGDVTGWDGVYIDPGAIVSHDGLLHMFYNGIDGFPRPVGVGYATSQDGRHWQRQVEKPLFHASDLFPNDPKIQNLFVTSGLVQPDGTWVLYFYTMEEGTFTGPQSIGRVTAPSPKGPWTVDKQLVLTPGPQGDWDSLQVSSPNVVSTPQGYVMYYDGMGSERVSMIGRAASADGIHWVKYNDPATQAAPFAESDPVLRPGQDGWDSKRVIDPNVLPAQNGWLMVYLSTTGFNKFTRGEYNLGLAASSDGIHWQKSAGSPILTSRAHPEWNASYLLTLVSLGDTYLLYMDFNGKGSAGTRVYLATHQGPLEP